MRSNLGRFHRPMSRGLVNNMLTMNNLGDGSTLSLDFTTMGGVLDPRLTFSRASPATFVNSSGYVQFANANCFTYSNPRPSGTAWGTTGTVTWNGVGAIADPIGGTNAQSFNLGTTGSAIFNTAGTIVVSGITHTFSVWLRTVTGTTNARIGSSNTGAVSTITVTDTWQRFSCQYVTNGTNDGGAVFSQTGSPSATMYVWGAQVQPGSIVGDLIQTSGTQNYSTPRFDYSPTNIGEPRGLLIEGQTANMCPQSQALTTGWISANMNTPTNPAIPDPFGGTSATWKLVAPISTSALRGWRHAVVTLTAANYTFSFWAKAAEFDRIVLGDPGSGRGGCKFVLVGNGTATVIAGSTTPTNPTIELFPGGWYRCSVTMLMLASTYAMGIAGYPSATTPTEYGSTYAQTNLDGVYATGFQIELGSGASSYVPTGASQVTRNVDNCYMNNISSLSYSTTNGTLFYESLTTKWNISSYPARLGFTKETGDYRSFGALTDVGGMLPNVGGPAGTPTVLVSLPFALNTNTKCAWSFDAALSTAELKATINGGTIVNSTASALTVSETPTYFGLGQKGYDLYLPCGPVKRVKYWPTTLTEAQLQALTAP